MILNFKSNCVSIILSNREWVNNWDIVDSSAGKIVGAYLLQTGKSRNILYQLVKSKSLWERRIAIIATQAFIKQQQFDDTLALAGNLLNDKEDLIHKAAGWMLREIGNQDQRPLLEFLNQNAFNMPRTMLRYAIEKLPPDTRRKYLDLKIAPIAS